MGALTAILSEQGASSQTEKRNYLYIVILQIVKNGSTEYVINDLPYFAQQVSTEQF